MYKLYALFTFLLCCTIASSQLAITEISYNPPEGGSDSLEYIEIYNTGDSDLSLNGYTFSAGVTHTFGDTSIAANSYMVIAVNSRAMETIFGVNTIQWESGGLSNGGEEITIENGSGTMVASVTYDDGEGWPGAADGTDGEGGSIELCDPSKDGNDPANWAVSTNDIGVMLNGRLVKGTPGTANSVVCPDDAAAVIILTNFDFTPADVTINVGDKIRWENTDGTHNVNGSTDTYPNNPVGFFSGSPTSQLFNFEFTFDVAGFYDYRCDPHFGIGMVGTVTVVDPNQGPPNLVITEIMYNDPGMVDSLEFIEILNVAETSTDLFGITFASGPTFTFPPQILAPGEMILVGQDSASLKKYFGVDAYQYDGGGLSSDGESIVLTTMAGDTLDEVSYLDTAPWPIEADGMGYSLILCDISGDNNDPASWQIATLPFPFNYEGTVIYADPGQLPYCFLSNIDATDIDTNGVATNEDKRVAIDGIAYGGNLRPGGLQFTVIDNANEGIAIFSTSESYGYTVTEGDQMRLYGSIDQFNGLTQLSLDTLIVSSQGASLVAPTVVTTLDETTESQLVTIENLTLVDQSDWGGSGSGFNVDVTNGTETYTIRIDADTDLFSTNYPTGTFSVTGLGGQFDNSSPYLSGYQLLPRNMMDIDPFVPFVEEFPSRTILEMTTIDSEGVSDSLNMKCTVEGTVYGYNLRPSGLQFTIIDDDNNGMGVFNNTGDLGYSFAEGDKISVKGEMAQFSGLTQIEPVEISLISSGNDLLTPRIVTDLDESTESSFIKMELMDFVSTSDWRGDGSSFNIDIMDSQGNTFAIRIDGDSELSTMAAPAGPFNLTGIGGQFDDAAPLTDGYQIFPRYASDFEFTSGVDDILEDLYINVFPNPVQDILNIESDLELISVEVRTLGGKKLLTTQDRTIDMSGLHPGVYFVKVSAEEGSRYYKVLKK